MQNEKEYFNVIKYIFLMFINLSCGCALPGRIMNLWTCDIMTDELSSLYKLIKNGDVWTKTKLRVKCKSTDALFNWPHCYRDIADKTSLYSQFPASLAVDPVILGNTPWLMRRVFLYLTSPTLMSQNKIHPCLWIMPGLWETEYKCQCQECQIKEVKTRGLK